MIFPDGPERLQTTPVSEVRAELHNTTSLYCSAEAVPPPSYQWLQEVPGSGEVRRRANTPTLQIMDVWYADQGTYRCVASNTVGGQTREQQSDLIRLDVTGRPQISSQASQAEGVLGDQAELQVEFCSDPGPIRNTWQWGEVILPSGNNYQGQSHYLTANTLPFIIIFCSDGKYSAQMNQIKGREDCYTSTLVISQLASEDMRAFSVLVENIHGTDTVKINLDIKGKSSLAG